MGFDRNGNVSLTNPGSVTPETPVHFIPAVYLSDPGAIGGTTPAAGTFTTLTATGLLTALGALVTPTAKTATSDGTGTGAIDTDESWLTCANGGSANNIITLPTPTPGRLVIIVTTGALEVRTTAPATIAINGGSGAGAESALPSGCVAVFFCASATTWLAVQIASNGTTAGVEAAAA